MITDEQAQTLIGAFPHLSADEQEQSRGHLQEWYDAQSKQAEQSRQSAISAAEPMFSDIKTLGGKWTAESESAVKPVSLNMDEDRAAVANMHYLAADTGKGLDYVTENYPVLMQQYAQDKYGKSNVSDSQLYSLIAGDIKQRQAQRDAQAQQIADSIGAIPQLSAPPTVAGELSKGDFLHAWDLASEALRRPFTPLLGPTDKQKFEESVQFGQSPDGTPKYEYKPLGSVIEQEGLIPSLQKFAFSASVQNVIRAEMLRQSGQDVSFANLEKERQKSLLPHSEDDSTAMQIGKGVFNAAQSALETLTNPAMLALPESKVLAGGFALQMAADAKQQATEAYHADTLQGKIEGWLGASVSLFFAYHGAKYGLHGEEAGRPTEEDIAKNINVIPDPVLQVAAGSEKFAESNPQVHAAAVAEANRRGIDPISAEDLKGNGSEPTQPDNNAKEKTISEQFFNGETASDDLSRLEDWNTKQSKENEINGTPERFGKRDLSISEKETNGTDEQLASRFHYYVSSFQDLLGPSNPKEEASNAEWRYISANIYKEMRERGIVNSIPEIDSYLGEAPIDVASERSNLSLGPGAADTAEFDKTPPQIKQLTDIIHKTISDSPKQSLKDRLDVAEKLSNEFSKTKDGLTKSANRIAATWEAAKSAYFKRPDWTNYKDAKGEWQGLDQKNSLNVREFVGKLKKEVPDPLRREAITNWIQADGDEALLRQRADSSKPQFKRGYETALQLTEGEKGIARNIQSYLEGMLQDGINSGILEHGVENYLTQIWKKENPVTKEIRASLQSGKLQRSFKYAKKRVFDSYFEGEQAGYQPASKDVSSLIGAYDLAFNRSLSARALIKNLSEMKSEDGKPITMLSGYSKEVPTGAEVPDAYLIKPDGKSKEAVTEDGRPYVPVDHPSLRGWKWVDKTPEGKPIFMQGDMLVHPDHATDLKNTLSSSMLRKNAITSTILNVGTFLKQSKMALSLFHLNQEGLHSIFHGINPFRVERINLEDPVQFDLVKHGLMVADFHAQELFTDGLTGSGLVSKVPGLGHIQNVFNDYLFKDYIPNLKMKMALDVLKRNTERYSGELSIDQIQELTAHQANAAFGELNYKMMGRNATVQDCLRLALLAPDFLESRFRIIGQALRPYGKEQRLMLLTQAAAFYVGSRILNQVLDDDPHWDTPFGVIYNGRQYELRSVAGDIGTAIADPRRFGYNRLSAFSRTALEAATGRDDRGLKRTAIQQIGDVLSWMSPITVQKRSDTTLGNQVLASVGLTSIPHSAQKDVYSMADKFMRAQQDPKIRAQVARRDAESHADSVYRELRTSLSAHNKTAAQAAYNAILKDTGKKPREVMEAMQEVTRPFTGSRHIEEKFKQSLNPSERSTYNKAIQERRQMLAEFKTLRL